MDGSIRVVTGMKGTISAGNRDGLALMLQSGFSFDIRRFVLNLISYFKLRDLFCFLTGTSSLCFFLL